MGFRRKLEVVKPPSELYQQLEFIYATSSSTGSLDQFKSQFPDSVLSAIFVRLEDTLGWSVDEILVMCYEIEALGLDFAKRKRN